jgi:hypothetical protein
LGGGRGVYVAVRSSSSELGSRVSEGDDGHSYGHDRGLRRGGSEGVGSVSGGSGDALVDTRPEDGGAGIRCEIFARFGHVRVGAAVVGGWVPPSALLGESDPAGSIQMGEAGGWLGL